MTIIDVGYFHFIVGKLEKFHEEQDVNPIPLDNTAHNSSESPKILEPHCGMKNLPKCCCQTTGELDEKILSQTVKRCN